MPSSLRRSTARPLALTNSVLNLVKSEVQRLPLRSSKSSSSIPKSHASVSTARSGKDSIPSMPSRRVARSRGRPHPIHTLPSEILAQIFLVAAQRDAMAPMAISHVCSTWRSIALHTPSLWRRLSLDNRVDMWKERVRRARACTLDVELFYSPSPNGAHMPQTHPVDFCNIQWYMHVVTPFIHRWRSLQISFPNYAPFMWNAALSSCCGRGGRIAAPAIEELSLTYPANDDTKEYTLFDGFAPRLRNVTVDGIRLTWLPSLFQNVTVLRYTHHAFTRGHQAISEVLTILQVSSRVEHLELSFPERRRPSLPQSFGEPTFNIVSLPYLRHFHISIVTSDIPSEMLTLIAHMHFPSLHSLFLSDDRTFIPKQAFPRTEAFFRCLRKPLSLVSIRAELGWLGGNLLLRWMADIPSLRECIVTDSTGRACSLLQSERKRSRRRRTVE
ncbi:hypothetical protein JAAARDRAFT_464053 [Jaapia argillacea MUCL 33604]|uniref:F-box domain-containing protein n=1 Tax=Jaapia argillacea MUCL 33604 TaxID=933084 RepID=A0A067QIW1_9AGAM|nr:hypothetical protein JAAARDRAFT_464053 [Jaapia argillacea MUCL 33604]